MPSSCKECVLTHAPRCSCCAFLCVPCPAVLCSVPDGNAVTDLPSLTVEEMATKQLPRTSTATGFALLQLQRGQVVVAVEDLSTATDWQIKAYQCLKLLMPLNNSAVTPETLDFAVYNYYCDKVVSADCWAVPSCKCNFK